jgi:exonuclease SbcC
VSDILLRVEQLTVEGFRGFNKGVELSFNTKTPVILLNGRNGLGKTSLLQAIEWCLTGNLLYFSGGDFAREDALVNMFHKGKEGFVEITLVDEKGSRLVIRRTKKMGKSTGRGGSAVETVSDKKTLVGEEAETSIFNNVFNSVDDPATLFHLHQDSLRQILMADPKERSRGIDKILGTFEIRDFVEALDIKRKVTQIRNKLESDKRSLERDRIQVAVATREKLKPQQEELDGQGWRDRLDLDSAGSELRRIAAQLMTAAKKLGYEFKPEKFEITKIGMSEANEIISNLRTETQKLDRSRIATASGIREKRTGISAALEQYRSAERAIEGLGAESIDSLEHQKKGFTDELRNLTDRLSEIHKTRKLLEEPAKTSRKIDLRQRDLAEQLKEIMGRIGDEKLHASTLEVLKSSLEKLQKDVNRFSKESRLLAVALDFMETTRPATCPLCMQTINIDEIISKLRVRSAGEVSKQVEATLAELNRKTEELRQLETDIGSLKRLSTESSQSTSTLQQLLSQVQSIANQNVASAEDLTKLIETLDQEMLTTNTHKAGLDAKIQALNERAKVLEQSRVMQGQATIKLQSLTASQARGEELASVATKELEKLGTSEQALADSSIIDQISHSLQSVANVIGYLVAMAELKKIEAEIPRISQISKDIDKRLGKLALLEGGVSSIEEVLRNYLTESVSDLLRSLETTINDYYAMLSGHPYFVKIRLEPDTKKPLTYNVKAVTKDETLSTYIPTRFSSAQMNVVGISLFLAHAAKMLNQLGFLMMDDPTQSLDGSRKKELVSVIEELSGSRQLFLATQDEEFSDSIRGKCGEKVAVWNFTDWSEQGPEIETTNAVSEK